MPPPSSAERPCHAPRDPRRGPQEERRGDRARTERADDRRRDQCRECPNACANAGDSVFTGSEPKPARITRKSATSGGRAAQGNAVAKRRPLSAACGRGRTKQQRRRRAARYEDAVQRERPRDAERRDRSRRGRRADRSCEVERHRVERDRLRHVVARRRATGQRLLRWRGERGDDAEPRREADHDRRGGEARPGEPREVAVEHGRRRPACTTSSRAGRSGRHASRPTARARGRCELAEVEDAEQERRVRQPVDEDRRGEVLEPRAARRRRVADEVRPEVPRADDPPRGPPDRPARCPGPTGLVQLRVDAARRLRRHARARPRAPPASRRARARPSRSAAAARGAAPGRRPRAGRTSTRAPRRRAAGGGR